MSEKQGTLVSAGASSVFEGWIPGIGKGAMMGICAIYRVFLEEVMPAGADRWAKYLTRYYQPNEDFLANYAETWSGVGLEEIQRRFDEFYPAATMDQLEQNFPPEGGGALYQELWERCQEKLRVSEGPDVYFMVGVYTSNAFTTLIAGRPMIGICLEHFNPGPCAHPWGLNIDPEKLPIWFSHEFAHCAAVEKHSGSLIRGVLNKADWDWQLLDGRVPLREWLWLEGVAVAFSHYLTGAPLVDCLGFSEEQFVKCQASEDSLFKKFTQEMDFSDFARYERWFGGDVTKTDVLVRPGYYLGYRVVEETVGDFDSANWDELRRLSPSDVQAHLEEMAHFRFRSSRAK